MKHIRNFCIIAHIDHGKSTLADRLLEVTRTVVGKDMQAQVLDNMDLERERGITIKSHAIQMDYTYNNEKYTLNLIDTPGHVDFAYEVSRSIAACEGALLIVDATQGIQAQTISNLYMAIEHDLEIIPIMNKMDMDNAMPEEVEDQIVELLGCKPEEIIRASGKTGMGVMEILNAIVERIKPPKGDPEAPLQCLIFDSVFNPFRGIITYMKIVNGCINTGDLVKFVNTGKQYNADEIGVLRLDMEPRKELKCGDVGYIISGIKNSKEVRVGDTITHVNEPCDSAIDGFEEVKPMVFAGIYPIDTDDFEDLRASIEKLQLNDAALTFQAESSIALGFGFRCGFLGMLHMEIAQERIEREYGITLVTTAPSVIYKVHKTNGEIVEIDNPSNLPDAQFRDYIEEPYVKTTIITPNEFVGLLMELAQSKRGIFLNMTYIDKVRVSLHYEIPLSEIITDFYDQLKSRSKGYASLDYEFSDYKRSDLQKLDILLAGEIVDALSAIVHKDSAFYVGQKLTSKLREIIPRQMFEVAIQAAIGGRIIARTNIKALRKSVLDKCYGGDISRKRKLLEKQKRGKKRMKAVGRVEVPQEAFMAVLSLNDD